MKVTCQNCDSQVEKGEYHNCFKEDRERVYETCGACGLFTKSGTFHLCKPKHKGGNDVMIGIIREECQTLAEFLTQKNNAYGNSVAEPINIFSRLDPLEQIDVRIDDKINRIYKGHKFLDDDDEYDLLGYLLLKFCIRRFLRRKHNPALEEALIRDHGDVNRPDWVEPDMNCMPD